MDQKDQKDQTCNMKMKIAGGHATNRKAIVDGVVMMDSAAERDGREMAVMVK